MMKFFIIFAALVAYTCASPTPELLHPSPVNPDVLVAIRPEEKIILITDPKEVAKFKRDTFEPFYPTVLPDENEHHVTKREHNMSHQNPVQENTQEVIKEKIPYGEEKQEHSGNEKVLDFLFKEFTLPIKLQKQAIPAPLVTKRHSPEESPKEGSEIKSDADKKLENLKIHEEKQISEQQQYKRDIPVPLVPKFHHPEETPKDSTEQEVHESSSSKDESTSTSIEHEKENISKEVEQDSAKEHGSPIHENIQDEKKEVESEHSDALKPHNQPQALPPGELISSTDSNQNVSYSEKPRKQHPLARPHPVPVAELFARNQDN